jgi:hypothetical protein
MPAEVAVKRRWLRSWIAAAVFAAASLAPGLIARADAQAAGVAPWTGARTPDGQPDIHGTWRPLIGGGRSLEDPGVPGGIEEEIARSQGQSKKNPSRVVDPPDGKVPYQPWAAALRQKQMENEIGATKPEHIDTQARCFILGAIRQAANANEFLQIPGFVILVNEAYHNYRVIPVDGRPTLPDTIKLWGGDSRGRWEGSTLVVEVKNLNAKNRLSHDGDFLSDTAHVVERYMFVDADHMNYEATIDDPRVFTQPWKIAIPNVRAKPRSTDEMWEAACHEGERSAEIMLQEAK